MAKAVMVMDWNADTYQSLLGSRGRDLCKLGASGLERAYASSLLTATSFLLFLFCNLAASPAQSISPLLGPTVVWERDTQGYAIFKVPSLVTDRERKVLLAIVEGRVGSAADQAETRLVRRRSVDSGRTWSEMTVVHQQGRHTVGNPAPVLDQETGVIWLFFCVDNRQLWLTSTADVGQTWMQPMELTAQLKRPEHTGFVATGPGHGIQLERGPKKSRLVVTGYANQRAVPPQTAGSKSFAIFSDDHGKSWVMGHATRESTAGGPDGNECMATELKDGRLYLAIRNNLTLDGRAYATSETAGEDWRPIQMESSLPEPVCEASIIGDHFAGGGLLHYYVAPAVSARSRKNKSARRDLSLWLSRDDCQHWQKQLQLWEGPSAYSDMAVLADGTRCVMFEAGQKRYDDKIVVRTFKVNSQ